MVFLLGLLWELRSLLHNPRMWKEVRYLRVRHQLKLFIACCFSAVAFLPSSPSALPPGPLAHDQEPLVGIANCFKSRPGARMQSVGTSDDSAVLLDDWVDAGPQTIHFVCQV